MYRINTFNRYKEDYVVGACLNISDDHTKPICLFFYYSEIMNDVTTNDQYIKIDPIIAKLFIENKISLINEYSLNDSKELFKLVFEYLNNIELYNNNMVEYQDKDDYISKCNLKTIQDNINNIQNNNNFIEKYYSEIKFSKKILLEFLNFMLEDLTNNDRFYD